MVFSYPLAVQDTYYIRPHHQDTESKHLYLIHSKKHREAVKMRRQRNMDKRKNRPKFQKEN